MIVIVGDSASGKSTVEKMLCEKYNINKVVSYTTRPPRENEVSGWDYNFIDMNDFFEMANNDEFVEIGNYRGWCYGSTKEQYSDSTVAVLTPHGLRTLKKKFTDEEVFSVYISIPRKQRLIKMLEREIKVDDVDECCRRSSSDVGMYDGICDEVDFVLDNAGYILNPEQVADVIYSKYKEFMEDK